MKHVLSLFALLCVTPALAQNVCPDSHIHGLALPSVAAAIAAKRPVLIVALGSSSSRGAQATDPGHSYPAVLQAELNRLLPGAEISVVNRGIDGQDAPGELARLGTDVAALRPQLVIWQVGANGALRGTDPKVFSALVTVGVRQLIEAGSDVILMDNQRAPAILHAPARSAIETELAGVAQTTKTNLFSRGALMDVWRAQGFGYDLFVSPDGLHHNDRGYRCISEALARDIVAAVSPPREAMSVSR